MEVEKESVVAPLPDMNAPVKIRKDYIPKAMQLAAGIIEDRTEQCPICSQHMSASQIAEHIRIELLDPKWREQRNILALRQKFAETASKFNKFL